MGLETGLNLGQKVITAWTKTGASNSLLAMKPVKVNIEGLKLAPVGDIFVSNTPKLTSKILPLQRNGELWEGAAKTVDGKLVGKYKCCIITPHAQVPPSDYPEGWVDLETGIPKKSFHIDYMCTKNAEHQGYGREMMKRFYLQSVEQGCEGRITLDSAWESGGFYKKLGVFEVSSWKIEEWSKQLAKAQKALKYIKKAEAEGKFLPAEYKESVLADIEIYSEHLKNPIKTGNCGTQPLFFTPTPENIAKLFSK